MAWRAPDSSAGEDPGLGRSARTVDRIAVISSLALLTAVGWWSLIAWPMPMPGAEGPATLSYAALTAVMWFFMMIAMMTPSVAPVVLLFASVSQQTATPLARTMSFACGYLSAWLLYSMLVSLLQVWLLQAQWIDAMGAARSALLTGTLFIAVGVYQWLPAKSVCLAHCRSPVQFLTHHYRAGLRGAWRMGLEHGLYCVGCCWLLMLLLFVVGVMNLGWVAGLALLVLIEKLAPRGDLVVRAVGLAMIAVGVARLV